MRAWIIGIAAFLLWSAGCTYWYVCWVKGLCWTDGTVVVAVVDSTSRNAAGMDSLGNAVAGSDSVGAEDDVSSDFNTEGNKEVEWDARGNAAALTESEDSAGKRAKPGSNASPEANSKPTKPKSTPGANGANQRPTQGKTGSGIGTPGERTILFAFATPVMGDAGLDGYLAQWSNFLKANPRKKVLLRGYTDDTAAREANLKLAQRRCDAIADLLRQRGVPDAQIVTAPLGEADPVATNDTPEGRSRNRRVVISLNE